MSDLPTRCLAGELFHVRRIRQRSLRSGMIPCAVAPSEQQAWIDHCAERVAAQNGRIRELLDAADDPHALLADARALLARP